MGEGGRDLGELQWCAPQDYMCEPFMLARTGLTVAEHQELTVRNLLELRERLGLLVVPVLQGWEPDEYARHVGMYERAGVDLDRERLVGVGSVCRRQSNEEAEAIFVRLRAEGLRLHGFGVKSAGLRRYADVLASADSLAWSYRARREEPLPGCPHKSCSNCLRFALAWRGRALHAAAGRRHEPRQLELAELVGESLHVARVLGRRSLPAPV